MSPPIRIGSLNLGTARDHRHDFGRCCTDSTGDGEANLNSTQLFSCKVNQSSLYTGYTPWARLSSDRFSCSTGGPFLENSLGGVGLIFADKLRRGGNMGRGYALKLSKTMLFAMAINQACN